MNQQRFKLEKPLTLSGERDKLQEFLVQCDLYIQITGIQSEQEKINFTKSLLRGAVSKWSTPYIKGNRDEE